MKLKNIGVGRSKYSRITNVYLKQKGQTLSFHFTINIFQYFS